jgi:hypothetical protein
MAIDSLSISLSSLPSPLYKSNMLSLAVSAVSQFEGSDVDVDRVVFELLYAAVGGEGGLLIAKSQGVEDTSSSTGHYSHTFPASDFAEPGRYQVRVRGEALTGPVVSSFALAESAQFSVLDKNQADSNNELSDEAASGSVVWKSMSLSGAQIKAHVADASQQASNMKLADLAEGSVLLGGALSIEVADADTDAVAKLGSGSSASNVVASADLDTVAAVANSASFVPLPTSDSDLNLRIDMGTGDTVSELADSTMIKVMWAVVVPASL